MSVYCNDPVVVERDRCVDLQRCLYEIEDSDATGRNVDIQKMWSGIQISHQRSVGFRLDLTIHPCSFHQVVQSYC